MARSIVLIGSGLSMVDVLLATRRDGFQGNAIVVSRRGQLPLRGVTQSPLQGFSQLVASLSWQSTCFRPHRVVPAGSHRIEPPCV